MNKRELERQTDRAQQTLSQPHPHHQLPIEPSFRRRFDPSSESGFELPQLLKIAMGSLDVDLNEELARYRQYVETHPVEAQQIEAQQIEAQEYALKLGTDEIIPDDEQVALAIAPSASINVLAEVDKAIAAVSSGDLLADERLAIESLASDDGGAIALHTPAPDSYLESSEALLRSLDELDEAKYQTPDDSDSGLSASRLWASLMSPLGIGSLMLLILSTATLGYVVVNPALLGFGDKDAATPGDDVAAGDASGSLGSGIFADLASSEFDELDLNSLSGASRQQRTSPFSDFPSAIDSDFPSAIDDEGQVPDEFSVGDEAETSAAQSTPLIPSQVQPLMPQRFGPPAPTAAQASAPAVAPIPAPTSVTQSSTPQSSSPPPSSAQVAPLPPVAPPSTASASESQSRATAVTEQPQDGFVYVVAPFTGDRSLEQAQQAVPGAHLRNFPQGAQVQLGAFSETERAQSLVEQLNRQGIPAELYQR
ncbi:MAG: hypothetical protein VKL39_21200 [Leptolyngbyaceae bacterium]|nr:hypothetical protein [Leptolyngbyaceae bacterium]